MLDRPEISTKLKLLVVWSKQVHLGWLSDANESLDWTLRHGRTVALSYAIFDAPEKLDETAGNDLIAKTVLKQASADRVCKFNYTPML